MCVPIFISWVEIRICPILRQRVGFSLQYYAKENYNPLDITVGIEINVKLTDKMKRKSSKAAFVVS